jgi:hypothetical protein
MVSVTGGGNETEMSFSLVWGRRELRLAGTIKRISRQIISPHKLFGVEAIIVWLATAYLRRIPSFHP